MIQIGRLLLERGCRPIFLSVCSSSVYSDAMERVAQALGSPYVNSHKIFRNYDVYRDPISETGYMKETISRLRSIYGEDLRRNPDWYTVFPDFCHPNPVGHDLIAITLRYVILDLIENETTPTFDG
jgi:hypothetical protein